MKSDSSHTVSSWMEVDTPPASTLTENTQADVCVIGAGIAGLTTAYLLTKEGKSVVVLDDGPVAMGESSRTTAHLANEIDDTYVEIERIFGADGARLACQSHTVAIDRIEAIAQSENIECDFERVDAYMFVAQGESSDELDEELEAARRAGMQNAEKLESVPVQGFASGGACLKFARQGQFHPLKYFAGLAQAITKSGGRIYTSTHVTEIDGGKEDGASARVKTSGGATVTCQSIVVATNTPFNDRVTMHTKQAAYRTYVIGARIERGAVAKALYWDTLDPYHYVRLQEMDDHDLLIIGGEDHKTGQEDDMDARFERLEAWGRQHFPTLGAIEYRWSGQVMETIDGLAYIGRNPLDSPRVFIATGDSGMGMTHGTIAGILLTDLIQGRENPWTDLYDPSRKSSKAGVAFAKENLNLVAQFADWVKGGDVSSAQEIANGDGAILRRGLHKVAAYRDESGALHECSAVCPHLGCVVAWNSLEKSWDCPCHGSRFDATGRVVNGPANVDLSPLEDK